MFFFGQMFLLRWYRVYSVKEAIRILLDFPVTIGSMEYSTESWPITCSSVGVQFLFSTVYLRCCLQILHESDAEVNVNLSKGALAFNEPLKVLVHVLPLGVLLFCLLLEVGKEVTLLLFFVKEIVTLIDDTLKSTATIDSDGKISAMNISKKWVDSYTEGIEHNENS